jgi:hypothetical protein
VSFKNKDQENTAAFLAAPHDLVDILYNKKVMRILQGYFRKPTEFL